MSDANEDGYYFRPRVDIELLLSLPAADVVITTACIGFWQYEDIEDILLTLHAHFKSNLYLEVHNHHTESQVNLNKRIVELSEQHKIEMIVGLDSHYIYPEESKDRDSILAAKGVHYEHEDGWFMDYPDDETVMQRFLDQGVLSKKQIQRAMDNTDVVLEFEDYAENNPVFSYDIKLPTLYPDKTQEEKNKIYSQLITKKFKEYMKDVPKEEYDRYFEGVKAEVQTYKDTGMVDYPLIDYEIIQEGIRNGGIITNSGRGSAVGFFTNTLCGFSKVDRFKSPITLYPERFISTARILESNSLPDIDFNLGNPEVFAEAQEKILGKNHAYPMIAFGTCKKKSAFKLYARSKNMDFELANTISAQIEKYDTAFKYAEDNERDEIDIFDYVDKEYHSYIEASKEYWGIIMDKKKAPCGYLLYDGDIREEIGLIKCKSETSKKEYITTVIDGAVAEKYKFLKNDLLKVDIVLLVDLVYKRLGLEPPTVNELSDAVKNDKKVWEIYSKGLTIGINQCEKASTTRKAMRFKPENVSELSAFIAAIRPAFKSMYSKLESREPFSYGISAFDNLLQTEELPHSFMLYQEQTMSTLNYAGFPIDECYGIIKDISKKHPEKVKPLKARFIEGFKKRIIEDDGVSDDEAVEMSDKVWQIISDSCNYSFNCVSGSTRIIRPASERHLELTVEEMYKIMNNREYAIETNHLNLHMKYQKYGYGKALSMHVDSKARPNDIVGIYEAGVRQTYEVKTRAGKSLICTDNHKFPTWTGKRRLDELYVGDLLYCLGEDEEKLTTKACSDVTYEKGIPIYLDEVDSIEPYASEMTYDIEMKAPYHTFISESGLVTSNSAHAYCMALDSLYCAYLKAHHPYEFYEVFLQVYSNKGKKDKVAILKQEMLKGFGIKEGQYRWGLDNRNFVADEDNKIIYPSLLSIKGLSQGCANDLYSLSQKNKYDHFYDVWKAMKGKKSLNSGKVKTLIQIDYFSDFGTIGKIQRFAGALDEIYDRSQFSKNDLPVGYEKYIKRHSEETDKQYRKFDYDAALYEIWDDLEDTDIPFEQRLKYELESIGYVKTRMTDISPEYAFVQEYECKFKNPKLTLYRLCNGDIEVVKVRRKKYDESPILVGDIIKTLECSNEGRWSKDENDEWQQSKTDKEVILKKWGRVKTSRQEGGR